MPKPTLVDVAKVAGVSAITVSRALRSPDMVSDSLQKKVREAVKITGYMPNKSASALASNRTNSVVVVIPSITNNVFTDVMTGVAEALSSAELTMQIGNAGYDPEEEERLLRSFLNPAPHGVILAGVEQTSETLRMLKNIDVPVVQIMDLANDPIGKIVGFSNVDAAEAGTRHLVEQGYRHIGFLGAQMDPRSQQRLAGFKHALEKAGQFDSRSTATTNLPSDVRMGATLLSKLVSQYPECDAVFCNNDDLALGALFECHRRGIKVPFDFGICGFNNLGITGECVPSITTIETPRKEIGRLAGKILSLDTSEAYDRKIDLGYSLVQRESTSR